MRANILPIILVMRVNFKSLVESLYDRLFTDALKLWYTPSNNLHMTLD